MYFIMIIICFYLVVINYFNITLKTGTLIKYSFILNKLIFYYQKY